MWKAKIAILKALIDPFPESISAWKQKLSISVLFMFNRMQRLKLVSDPSTVETTE
jgi:hypothetical protein